MYLVPSARWMDNFDTLILPRADTACMQLFLDEVAQRHHQDNIVMVLDGAGWHTTGKLTAPVNMRLLFLPPVQSRIEPRRALVG